MSKTGGGSFKIFRRNFFCLTVQKIFVGEPFSVSLISGIEKVWLRGGGGVSSIYVEFFLSQSAQKFPYGIPLLLQ